MIYRFAFFCLVFFFMMISHLTYSQAGEDSEPLRVGIAGLSHSHVRGILNRPDKGDIEIVGIVESDMDLAKRYSDRYGYSMDIVYASLEEMLDAIKPEAVLAFNSIYEHLAVVQACAPRDIHVMVEKPLAVNLQHAQEMEKLARQHKIHLLTNFETTWYSTNHKAYEMVENGAIGKVRKVVVRDGHEGPMEIGVNQEFLDWLTDPILNGGGAIIDFGCYGANLITWLMKGEKPVSVYALTKQLKPDIYPKVDDEATIIVNYPEAQGIIQASWNWPFSRKDMDVFGQTGYISADNKYNMRFKLAAKVPEKSLVLEKREDPYNDPFAYLSGIVRGRIQADANSLSSLENNMIVVEILDAAVRSSKSGKEVKLK
ncbi:Gfo/Idh/MocA family oxidoreductase [Reichenbachiella sp. MALMAid0571]|uniref:Gfo/Idh/MocA family protein n=1 Tax=Reichenbachiella sp. MALMAid0571 TaxID=3143939 RepID=UPI0032DFB012